MRRSSPTIGPPAQTCNAARSLCGAARSAEKTQTTARITNNVLTFFRTSGRGCQTRIDEALSARRAAFAAVLVNPRDQGVPLAPPDYCLREISVFA